MKKFAVISLVFFLVSSVSAQTKDAYDSGEKTKKGLFDPTRLIVNHSVSFGAASNSGVSNFKTQSMYSTMLQYSFLAPVTLNLNFGLPIHSTFNSAQNLSADNLRSADYFNSIPFDFSLTWKPTENTNFILSISKMNSYDYFGYNSYNMWNRYPYFNPDRDTDK